MPHHIIVDLFRREVLFQEHGTFLHAGDLKSMFATWEGKKKNPTRNSRAVADQVENTRSKATHYEQYNIKSLLILIQITRLPSNCTGG